jgi:hypothetical protein
MAVDVVVVVVVVIVGSDVGGFVVTFDDNKSLRLCLSKAFKVTRSCGSSDLRRNN